MNWLDIVILCLAGIGFVKGLFDGVIKQVVSLIALGLGIYFCAKGASLLRSFVVALEWFPDEWVTLVSYVLAFLLIVGIVMLAGEIVHRLVGVTPLSIFNHLAGGVFGILLVTILISLLFNFAEVVDPKSNFLSIETKIESRFYKPVKEILPSLYPKTLFTREHWTI